MHSKIIVTEDNSKTLLIPDLNETYHSTKGALTEALHVFIKAGIDHSKKNELNIFEMGMGTGLNAILSLQHALNKEIKINYTTIEKYPLDLEKVERLNYPELNGLDSLKSEFEFIHSCKDGETHQIKTNFSFKKIHADIKDFPQTENSFDIIFFDAFGPKIQPKLWTENIINKMHQNLNKNGFLVTYCAQGAFKRNLKAVGFEVENIPGPPGKREMTRAIKR